MAVLRNFWIGMMVGLLRLNKNLTNAKNKVCRFCTFYFFALLILLFLKKILYFSTIYNKIKNT